MILRRARRTRAHAAIRSAVHCCAEYLLLEQDIRADDSRRQVVLHLLTHGEHRIDFVVAISDHDLEWAEQLPCDYIECSALHGAQRDPDCRWLIGTEAARN